MAERLGQQLGNYLLTRLLGEGGFAEVYLGEHIHLGTVAAVKVLHAQLTTNDVAQFNNEARTIAHLEHPHIVRVLDYGVENKTPFLVLIHAANGSLRQRHPKGTVLSLGEVVSYIQQLAPALQYAHDEKLIHRDIKPENMLLGRNNEVLLSDFGIAVVAQSSRYQEGGQEIGGTIAYMAPEQLQGRAVPASDQYALGIITYEWLSGDRPFQGSFPEIASQHMLVPPAPLRLKIPGIPKDIEEVVMRALAKDPQQRFMRVEAYANALEHACQVVPPLVIQSGQSSPGTQNTLSDQSRTALLGVEPQNQFPSGNYGAIAPGQLTPNLNGTPPSPSLKTDMLGTPQGDQPTNTYRNILPGQSSPGFSSMPTYQSQTSPGQNLSRGQFLSTPRDGKNPPANKGVSRRVVVLGLAGLAGVLLLGGGLSLLAHSSQSQNATSGNSTSNTDTTPVSNDN